MYNTSSALRPLMTGKTSTPLYNTTSNFGCQQRLEPSKCEAWILSYSIIDAVTQDRYLHVYTMLHDVNSGNSTARQSQRAVSAYCRVSRCVFSFSMAEWISSGLSGFGQTFWGLHKLHIHTDFKIVIFRRQIYIILIYLLQRSSLISSCSNKNIPRWIVRL